MIKEALLNIRKILYYAKKAYKQRRAAQKRDLGGAGERVDIVYSDPVKINFDNFNIYQKSHYKRYEYAQQILPAGDVTGDFACGTGYGSVMLSRRAKKVIGVDINEEVIKEVKKRYRGIRNVAFETGNLLDLKYRSAFDSIVSFETIEHFAEADIPKLLLNYHAALKEKGSKLIFSTPYMQERTEAAIQMGFHLTFYIDEARITQWLDAAGFELVRFKYQDYATHSLEDNLAAKDFIVCVAKKK